MRRSLKAFAFVAAAFGVVGLASADTTIHFGEAGLTAGFGPDPWYTGNPKGTNLGNQFNASGVKFEMFNGAAYVSDKTFIPGCNELTWDSFLAVNTTPPYASTEGVLSVTFWDPNDLNMAGTVDGGSISFKVSDKNAAPSNRVTIRTFGLGDALIEELALTSYEQTLIFSMGAVHEIQFIDSGSDGFVMDDFSFGNVSIVPEPSSIGVLAVGALALAAKRRRK